MKDTAKKIGIIVIAVVIAAGAVLFWHRKKTESLRQELKAAQEAELAMQEAIDGLAEEYGIEIREKSDIGKAISGLKDKFDKWFQRDNYILDAREISSKIAEISELATIEYQYNNVGLHFYKGDKLPGTELVIPYTGTTVAISMDGTVKAGIDLSEVRIECDHEKKCVTVRMPEAKILSNELNEESLKVCIDDQSIFNRLSQEQHNELRRQIKDKGVESAKKSDILKLSGERAKQVIRELIDSIQKGKGDYEVVFKAA
ncbi:MAG: DUF4230 domain-containing protein [Oscillospiraceae bacterium]|nr:DUF4230 domain-containing protein [Oscillospiraceae bacterium]